MACRLCGAKPLSEPMLDNYELDPYEQTSVKSLSKFYHFRSRKCVWKCRLRNGGHFVSASMCSTFYRSLVTLRAPWDIQMCLCASGCLMAPSNYITQCNRNTSPIVFLMFNCLGNYSTGKDLGIYPWNEFVWSTSTSAYPRGQWVVNDCVNIHSFSKQIDITN